MRYVTESLAEALYQARKNRMEEAPEVKKVNESEEEAPEVKKTVNESEESEDFTDVDDREPEADDEEAVDDAIDESNEDSEEVDEARWVTMKNKNHALIDDDGSVLAGGDPKTHKKVSRKEIEAAAKDAGSK